MKKRIILPLLASSLFLLGSCSPKKTALNGNEIKTLQTKFKALDDDTNDFRTDHLTKFFNKYKKFNVKFNTKNTYDNKRENGDIYLSETQESVGSCDVDFVNNKIVTSVSNKAINNTENASETSSFVINIYQENNFIYKKIKRSSSEDYVDKFEFTSEEEAKNQFIKPYIDHQNRYNFYESNLFNIITSIIANTDLFVNYLNNKEEIDKDTSTKRIYEYYKQGNFDNIVIKSDYKDPADKNIYFNNNLDLYFDDIYLLKAITNSKSSYPARSTFFYMNFNLTPKK